MKKSNAVEVARVARAYQREAFEVPALDNVTLGMPRQSFVAVMGTRKAVLPTSPRSGRRDLWPAIPVNDERMADPAACYPAPSGGFSFLRTLVAGGRPLDPKALRAPAEIWA